MGGDLPVEVVPEVVVEDGAVCYPPEPERREEAEGVEEFPRVGEPGQDREQEVEGHHPGRQVPERDLLEIMPLAGVLLRHRLDHVAGGCRAREYKGREGHGDEENCE